MEQQSNDEEHEGWRVEHAGFELFQPSLAELDSFITPTASMFTVVHMGVFSVSREKWRMRVDGLVRNPIELTYDDLMAFEQIEVVATHECAGSPLNPTHPVRRVGTVRWRGVLLSALLEKAEVLPEARYLWSKGADWGSFNKNENLYYQKDLSLELLQHHQPILATHINGEELTPERGAPVRLVVPECYGTNSTKWLTNLHLADKRATGYFSAVLYNEEVNGQMRPVWQIAPHAVFVSHQTGMSLSSGVHSLQGWAWASGGVDLVEVSVDGGVSWAPAQLQAKQEYAWQRFAIDWRAAPGQHRLACRARACDGRVQPQKGARNEWFWIEVNVA
ncbi:molybdopterin-dependent oxidoreductase [Massilia sp. W12]|uniref:molybdopterin-dependent oxidoreductase n=1 Tax=Massilia sp. W12 TaxID=3126507 RepID=UPI0030CDE10B